MAQYYLSLNGQQLGPFEVNQLPANGLTPDAYVWTEGMANWMHASEVPELASLFAAPAPTPAPAAAPQPQYQAPQPQYQAPQPQYQAPQPQYQQPYQQPAMGNYVATPQMGFMEAVKTCLKKFFTFKGRARRSEFWWFMLASWAFNSVVNGVLGNIVSGLMAKKEALINEGINIKLSGGDPSSIEAQDPTTTIIILCILMGIIGLIIFIPQLSAMVRRLHDVGKSGKILWLYLLCGIGGIIGLILSIPDGQPQTNKYGESPKYKLQQ